MVSPDECEEGGGGRAAGSWSFGGDVGDAMASSSGFAMRRPPRAPLNDRSALMLGSIALQRQRLSCAGCIGASAFLAKVGMEKAQSS